MNPEKIAYFKDKLLKEKNLLIEELSTVGKRNPDNPDDFIPVPPEMDISEADRNEVADRIEEFGNDIAITRDLEIKFAEVKDALEKIEKGTYGVCEVSQELIEEDRLEANPAARTCKKHM